MIAIDARRQDVITIINIEVDGAAELVKSCFGELENHTKGYGWSQSFRDFIWNILPGRLQELVCMREMQLFEIRKLAEDVCKGLRSS